MNSQEDIMLKIYLIGSFHNFRDYIIKSLPQYLFADPRLHHQSSSAKMVVDDMNEAENCPIAIAVFPKGKSRGVMSYAEIGATKVNGNTLITVDEDENFDPFLKKLTKPEHYFISLDSTIGYLASNPHIELNHRQQIISKYPPGEKGIIPMNRVYICGTIDPTIRGIVEEASRLRPDKQYVLKSDEYEDLKEIIKNDLVVANFPADKDWDRHACAMLGAAYSHDISTVIMDQHKVKYPPLQALARRHMSPEMMLKYITRVDDLNIGAESGVMYNLFKEEQEKHL